MSAKMDIEPSRASHLDSCVVSTAKSGPCTTSQVHRNAIQIEVISTATRKTVPKLNGSSTKLRSRASCCNRPGGSMNEVCVIIVGIMLIPQLDQCRRTRPQDLSPLPTDKAKIRQASACPLINWDITYEA